MAKHRIYSVEFKRQVVQDYLTGETLHGLAKRHDISRNLIRLWIAKHEAVARSTATRPLPTCWPSTTPGSRRSSGLLASSRSRTSF